MHNEDQYILSRLIILEGELLNAKERYDNASMRKDLWYHKADIRREFAKAEIAYVKAQRSCCKELLDRTLHHDINDQDFPNLNKLLAITKRIYKL